MRRTTYKVHSGLFPPDLPSRMFFAQTNRRIGGYEGSVVCVHFDPQGRRFKAVICAKAGTWSSRKTALRKAKLELSKFLLYYPSENIIVSVQNT